MKRQLARRPIQIPRVHGRSFSETTLDLNDLLVFVRVAEARSLTIAAATLGLPKSSVSRRLAALEERLGVRLIQRTTRKLALTEIGELYFERCSSILSEVTAANKAVTDMQATPTGRLRISAPEDLSSAFMGRVIAEFVALHRDISVELVATDRAVDLIAESFDAVIRFGALRESSLIARRLTQIEGVLCASPSYLARRGTPTVIEELDDHDLSLFVPSGVSELPLTDGKRSFALPSKARLISNQALSVCDALLTGLGIGALPTFLINEYLAAGTLVRVLPAWTFGTVPVHLVYPARRNIPTRLALFIDYVIGEFESPPWESHAPIGGRRR